MNLTLGYRQKIVSGETTLQELASQVSDCSSARNGGDLGFFGRGQMQSKLIACNCVLAFNLFFKMNQTLFSLKKTILF